MTLLLRSALRGPGILGKELGIDKKCAMRNKYVCTKTGSDDSAMFPQPTSTLM